MKKLKYSIVLLLALLIGGCNEEAFLKEDPRDSLYPENLLVDYAGFESMVTSLYGMMRNEYRRADALGGGLPIVLHASWSCGVDNSWSNNSHSDFKFFYYPKQINQTDLVLFSNIFQWLYRIVNTSNMIISRAEGTDIDWQGSGAEGDVTNKNKILARARFFRAWAYRHLTYSFGAVPLSTEEITGLNYRADWERNPVAEIREVMEQDFTFAMNNLPLREASNSMISGATARHYLGELYLAMDKPDKAVTVLKPLVEGSEYGLMTARFGKNASNDGCPFIDVFRTPMYADGNTEVLLAFVNTEPENTAFGTAEVYMKSTWKNYYSNDGVINKSNLSAPEYVSNELTWPQAFWLVNGGKGAGRCVPSRGAFRLYNYKDQGTIDDRVSNHAIVWNIMEKDATGKLVEYRNKGKMVIDTLVTAAMINDDKTTIKKYNWPTTRKWEYIPPLATNGDKDGSYQDIVYLRLAETYLLYAEALYETNASGEAIKWINEVRNRSHAVSISESDLTAKGLDLILDERSRELLSEEERRHTLIRVSQEKGKDERDVNNYFKRRTRLYNEIAGRDVRGMNEYDTPVLFPIPQEFIDSNTGRVLVNNPGYIN